MASLGDDKKPYDVATTPTTAPLGDKIGDTSVSLIDAAAESADQVKSVGVTASEGAGQVKNFVGYNIEQGKQLTSSARIAIRRAGAQVLDVIKTGTRPVAQVFEKADNDGTALRKQISNVRVQLNEQLHGAEVQLQKTKQETDETLVPVRRALADFQIQLIKVNQFRREQPEAAVAGLIAVVGLPSLLLRGKAAAARNVLVAVGGGAAIAYGTDRLDAKKK